MKYDNQLRYAVSIIKQYDGRFPLSVWLKNFFRENKQMGSRDRRTVSHLVYSYYRLGHTAFDTIEARVLAAMAVCQGTPQEIVEYFKPSAPAPDAVRIFPWASMLSDNIDAEKFALSFLQQPSLFLRVRSGKLETVLRKLDASKITYQLLMDDSCILLANSTKIEDVLEINREVVIQDLSSQKVGRFMQPFSDISVWDCCAASGGKAIMANDLIKNLTLTVSDIRPSILHNLHERFRDAGIREYTAFTADLAADDYLLPDHKYDLIIADVPCSGSGTWGRTPEQLNFFSPEKLRHYTILQKKIVTKVIPALKPGGVLLYVTCSVFKSENEEAVSYMMENHSLKCASMGVIRGYDEKADTMFTAVLRN